MSAHCCEHDCRTAKRVANPERCHGDLSTSLAVIVAIFLVEPGAGV